MKVIAMNRGTGKTTKLIKLCSKSGGYIVCRRSSVNLIMEHTKKLGLSIPYPLSYEEFISRNYCARGVKKVYIDDLDDFLNYISSVPVEAVTVDKELLAIGKRLGNRRILKWI